VHPRGGYPLVPALLLLVLLPFLVQRVQLRVLLLLLLSLVARLLLRPGCGWLAGCVGSSGVQCQLC